MWERGRRGGAEGSEGGGAVTVSRMISGYWGKSEGEDWHPLAYHMLDVAAVVETLLDERPDLRQIARDLAPGLDRALPLLAALHDLGKIALPFQCLRPDLRARLSGAGEASCGGRAGHGDLGLLIWSEFLAAADEVAARTPGGAEVWRGLAGAVFGHHGTPCAQPYEMPPFDPEDLFAHADTGDCEALARSLAALLGAEAAGPPMSEDEAREASWWVAGLLVLADWIGSNRDWFDYHPPTLDLDAYYRDHALPHAHDAVKAAGLIPAPASAAPEFSALAPGKAPTPLQALCGELTLGAGPQLFIVEDATGSGKTEAALLLAWRLWAAGAAGGLYLGLPTQATSNAMFARLRQALPPMFRPGARPSVCLAHGKSWLHPDWRAALAFSQAEETRPGGDEPSPGSLAANAWLADNRKKALLAEVGVGTLDQALIGILPARHQSLRLFGLGRKVLIADEVHAYDAYTGNLLETLLTRHARLGGSAVILSATLTARQRGRLVAAFRAGRGDGFSAAEAPGTAAYPLLTHWGEGMAAPRCLEPAASRRSRLRCARLESADDAVERIVAWAAAGRCVAWVRNTVGDARQAFAALRAAGVAEDDLMLFHSAFAPADRAAVERQVRERFGKDSGPEDRRGKVLVASQVIENSVDFDFDEMVSDLAPVDALIQRAGRQHRHPGRGERAPAVFHILGPEAADAAPENWYSRMFPAGAYVYPDAARLWRTQRLLTGPEAPAEGWDLISGVRALIETVYGPEDALPVPEPLQSTLLDAEGVATGNAQVAGRSVLDFGQAYGETGGWGDDIRARTRLGEDTRAFALAVWAEGTLRPWAAPSPAEPLSRFEERRAWAESEIDLPLRRADDEEIPDACHAAVRDLCARLDWRDDRPRLLILSAAPDGLWTGPARRAGKPVRATYSPRMGLWMEAV